MCVPFLLVTSGAQTIKQMPFEFYGFCIHKYFRPFKFFACRPLLPHLASFVCLSGNPSVAFIFCSLALDFSEPRFYSTPADIHHAPLTWQFSEVIFNYASMSFVIRAETLPPPVRPRPETSERVCYCLDCVSERKLKCVFQIESVWVDAFRVVSGGLYITR